MAGLLEWANSVRYTMATDPGRQLFQDQLQTHGFIFLDDYLDNIVSGPCQDPLIELVKTPGRKKVVKKLKDAGASKLNHFISGETSEEFKENVAPVNSFHTALLKEKDEAAAVYATNPRHPCQLRQEPITDFTMADNIFSAPPTKAVENTANTPNNLVAELLVPRVQNSMTSPSTALEPCEAKPSHETESYAPPSADVPKSPQPGPVIGFEPRNVKRSPEADSHSLSIPNIPLVTPRRCEKMQHQRMLRAQLSSRISAFLSEITIMLPNLPKPAKASLPWRHSLPCLPHCRFLGAAIPGAPPGGQRTSWLKKAREVKALERKSGDLLTDSELIIAGDEERRSKSAKNSEGDVAPRTRQAEPKCEPPRLPTPEHLSTAQEGMLDRFRRTVEGLGAKVGKSMGKSLGGGAAVSALAEARAAAEARVAERHHKEEESQVVGSALTLHTKDVVPTTSIPSVLPERGSGERRLSISDLFPSKAGSVKMKSKSEQRLPSLLPYLYPRLHPPTLTMSMSKDVASHVPPASTLFPHVPASVGLTSHLTSPSSTRVGPLSKQSTLESLKSDTIFDDTGTPAWMPNTQDTEQSSSFVSQSRIARQHILDEDDSWPLDEKLAGGVQWTFGADLKEDSMTWSTLPSQSQRADTTSSHNGHAVPQKDEVQPLSSRAVPGAFDIDMVDDHEPERGLAQDRSEMEDIAMHGTSTIGHIEAQQERKAGSQEGFTNGCSCLLKSNKKNDKKAARLKEMENRRQLALQRKAEEEKTEREQERKMKEEGERRKRERDETTEKRPLKGVGKKDDDATKKRKVTATEVEKKELKRLPSKSALKPTSKQPSALSSSAAYNASIQINATSTSSKPLDSKSSKTPVAVLQKGKGKPVPKELSVQDDEHSQPSHLVQIQMAARAKAQLQAAKVASEPPVASESIELPEINSEYSDSEDEDRAKSLPEWAQSPELREALQQQSTINPDDIFGAIRPLRMEELFKTRTSRFRARTSSANWTGADRLTLEEERNTPSGWVSNRGIQIHEEVLEDLSSRFILNLPDDELSSLERICFQVEQAHWFYEDFIREENPKFPSLPLKKFSAMLFHACPLLHQWSHDHEQAFNTFMQYKTRVPVCGAIMLNDTWEKCLLVKGWKSSSGWGFPKGKINQVEPPASCAIREVLEETGYNLAGQIDPDNVIEMSIREQKICLFIVPGVPEDFPFKTKTRKEISKIQWFRLTDLPTWKRNKTAAGRFYLISPFIGALKAFIHERKPRIPRKALRAKKSPPTQPRNEQPYSSAKDISHESSSQSSSAENGEPETPSPHYSEPHATVAEVADNESSKLDQPAVTMDPHFANLLSALAISASARENKSSAPPPPPHTSPSLAASIDWSASVPQRRESSVSSQHDISSLGSATPSGRSLQPLPQMPLSPLPSTSIKDYDKHTTGGMSTNSEIPSRSITSPTSSRTADISPYLSAPMMPSALVTDRTKQHIALLEAVSAESARLMQAYKTAAANGAEVNVTDSLKYSAAPGFTATPPAQPLSRSNGWKYPSSTQHPTIWHQYLHCPRILECSIPLLRHCHPDLTTLLYLKTQPPVQCMTRSRYGQGLASPTIVACKSQPVRECKHESEPITCNDERTHHPPTPPSSNYAQPPQNRNPLLPPFHTPRLEGQRRPLNLPQFIPHQTSGPFAPVPRLPLHTSLQAPLPTNNTLLSILNNSRVVSNVSPYPAAPIGPR
ncbi:putative dcp2, box A domain [Lyophyllum shimeji]|uniref:Dcp2, box A domain n=1 Tax=Lyophyllum shimeji TaxID=47721 RepID=A0A9P3PHN8_LYOSH|nr:putative dcp2, box A domain [Lyophyllum shimeji]